MFKYSFVILCYVAFVSKQSSAFDFNFCSSDALPTLIQCLLKAEKYDKYWFRVFDQRIECSKEGDCTPAPWQVLDSEIRIVRKYFKCMEKIAYWKYSGPLSGPETKKLIASEEFNCRKELALNLPEDFKSYCLPLLPEINEVNFYHCSTSQ